MRTACTLHDLRTLLGGLPNDTMVFIDGVALTVDYSKLPEAIHLRPATEAELAEYDELHDYEAYAAEDVD